MVTTHRPRAVIVGPPGAGKSTIGALLAERLGVEWRDTDTDIELDQGRSVPDIFVVEGEPAFREMERAAVARALEECDGVVSLGGGAPMDARTRELLTGQRVVFLDVGIADAAKRVGFDASRPLLVVNPRASWIAMMKERRPTYQQVAVLRVDTAGRPPAEVVDEIVAGLEGLEGLA